MRVAIPLSLTSFCSFFRLYSNYYNSPFHFFPANIPQRSPASLLLNINLFSPCNITFMYIFRANYLPEDNRLVCYSVGSQSILLPVLLSCLQFLSRVGVSWPSPRPLKNIIEDSGYCHFSLRHIILYWEISKHIQDIRKLSSTLSTGTAITSFGGVPASSHKVTANEMTILKGTL